MKLISSFAVLFFLLYSQATRAIELSQAQGFNNLSQETKNISRPDPYWFLKQLRSNNYTALEEKLRLYQSSYESGQLSDQIVQWAYASFYNSDPAIYANLNAWVKAKPNSYMARMARASYLLHLGWSGRQGKFASETKAEQFQLMEERFSLAAKDLASAIELNPKLTIAYAAVIMMARANIDLEERRNFLRKALVIDPASYAVREAHLAGIKPKWGGSMDELNEFLDDTLKRSVTNKDLSLLAGYDDFVVGDALMNRGRDREAIGYLSKAITASKNQAYYQARGKSYYNLGDYQAALNDFDNALAAGRPTPGSLGMRGWTNIQLKNYEEAINDFNQAVQLDELNALVRRGRGTAFEALGRYQEALKDFTASLAYGAYDDRNWYARGRLYLTRFADYRKAESDLKKAVELGPQYGYNLFNYGDALSHLNKCEGALAFSAYVKFCDGGGRGCNGMSIEHARKVMGDNQLHTCKAM